VTVPPGKRPPRPDAAVPLTGVVLLRLTATIPAPDPDKLPKMPATLSAPGVEPYHFEIA
jgi:hypothetical protein